jgi:bifunctional enzyme CysN/CysC
MVSSILRILTCGSVDDGKSTLIGRLLFECDAVPDDVMATLGRHSKRWGTAGDQLDYALLVDGLAAEREQGITVDVAYRYFTARQRRFILADCPGHEQYTRNMVTGASTADLAILLIDARKGVLAQTRRHATIVSLLGIRNVVLAVNKMDLVEFSQSVFNDVCAQFAGFAKGLNDLSVTAIPVVARDGDNVTRSSARMDWYKGPDLLSALETAETNHGTEDEPFRMHVQLVSRVGHDFRGFAGTVANGTPRRGMSVVNVVSGMTSTIARIVTADGDLDEARAGDAITLVLDTEIDVSRGDVLACAAARLPDIARRIAARVVWMGDTPLFRGRPYLFMAGTRTISGTITDITNQLDLATLAEVPARELRMNEIGRVNIALNQLMVFEPYQLNHAMGGFIIVDRLTNATVGVGMTEGGESAVGGVYWQETDIDKEARSSLKSQRPAVLWFTGLSGAGKSTIANLVEKRLHAIGHHTMLLDGDNVRHGLNRDLGFSEADRVENIRRIAEVSRLFVDAGTITLVSFISPYRAERMMARECVAEGEFLEIYVDTPIAECRRRDPKGLYARADKGILANFTGVSAPYEAPERPDIHLETETQSPEALADQVILDMRRLGVIA